MIQSYGFPQLPRRKKKKNERGGIFPHYIDYSRATVAAGDTTSPMGQGVSGQDMGAGSPPPGPSGPSGMGEAVEAPMAPSEDTTAEIKPAEEAAEKPARPYQFGCAMFMLPETQAFMVHYWTQKNIPKESLDINPDIGHDGYEDEPHVTIKFGLHDMDPKNLEQVADGFGPVALCLGKVKKFDHNPVYDVLCIEVTSPRLMELNELCKTLEAAESPFKDYQPHVTLAFVKKGSGDKLVDNDFFDGLEIIADEITYANKDGDEFKVSLEVV